MHISNVPPSITASRHKHPSALLRINHTAWKQQQVAHMLQTRLEFERVQQRQHRDFRVVLTADVLTGLAGVATTLSVCRHFTVVEPAHCCCSSASHRTIITSQEMSSHATKLMNGERGFRIILKAQQSCPSSHGCTGTVVDL
jgi:hypothetical protein